MRIAILGAGGLGSQLGATLHEGNRNVLLIARGAHLEALQSRGLTVVDNDTNKRLAIPARAADETLDPFDLVFVTVKSYALAEVAPIARRLAGETGLIVPLVNGVDAKEQLAAAGVPRTRVRSGVAYLTAFRTEPGIVVRHGSHQRLVFGDEPSPDGGHRIADAFVGTEVDVELVPDIRVELWRKMAVVCALTALCGSELAPIGAARGAPDWPRLQRIAVAEVLAVANAVGVPLGEQVEAQVHTTLDGFDDGFYPSLLHDLQRGQRTEVEALNATVSALGGNHQVPTPSHDAAVQAIRDAEARGRI